MYVKAIVRNNFECAKGVHERQIHWTYL